MVALLIDPEGATQSLTTLQSSSPLGQLAKLPLEVRERIYGYVIGSTRPIIKFTQDRKSKMTFSPQEKVGLRSILPLSRQFKLEASLGFIRQADFFLEDWSRGTLYKYLGSFPENQGFEAVRRLGMFAHRVPELCGGEAKFPCLNPPSYKDFPGLKSLTVSFATRSYDMSIMADMAVPALSSGIFREIKLVHTHCRCTGTLLGIHYEAWRAEHMLRAENYFRGVRDAIKKGSKEDLRVQIELEKDLPGVGVVVEEESVH
jgi:hypothetical protein